MSPEMQQNTDAFGGAVYVKASAEAPAFSYTDPLPFFRKEFLVKILNIYLLLSKHQNQLPPVLSIERAGLAL